MPDAFARAESIQDTSNRFVNKGVWEALRFAWGNPDFPLDRDSKEFEEFSRAYWSLASRFAEPGYWEKKFNRFNSARRTSP